MPKGGMSVEYSKSIGALVSNLRRDRGLTQKEAARLSGLSQKVVSNLENGKSRSLPKTALRALYSLATPESGLGEVDALVAAIPPLAQEMEFWELVEKVGDDVLARSPYIFSGIIAEKLGMEQFTVYKRLRSHGIIG